MATSGSTDWTLTSRQLITAAMELCGSIGIGDTPEAEEADMAMKHLNMLLKTWGTDRKLFIMAEAAISPLVLATASYSLPAARRVTEVRRRIASSDTPLQMLSRQEYFDLPNKSTTAAATAFWFDPQRTARTLYIWPVPTAAEVANATLRYTYHRVIEDVDALDNDPDVPQEWLEALTYSLAARIAIPLKRHIVDAAGFSKIEERAALLYAQLTADSDEDASVFFSPA